MTIAHPLAPLLAGNNPVSIARQLIGVELYTNVDGVETSGIITETEAYWAPEDQASHASNHRRTGRTEVFFGPAATSYVYLIYGIHELFNVITGPQDVPHAVLIRAVAPMVGLRHQLNRRVMKKIRPQLTAGPGVLTKALGINRSHNGLNLLAEDSPVQLRVTEPKVQASEIVATPRIGIAYAGEPWTNKPWRFYLSGTPFVSQLKAFK